MRICLLTIGSRGDIQPYVALRQGLQAAGHVVRLATHTFGDQFFWGQRVAALKAGPNPIPQKRLSVRVLAEALEKATENAQMRSHAAVLGTQLRAEQGVERAVRAIEQSYNLARRYPD